MKIVIRKISAYQTLCRNPKTGIAWIEDGSTGLRYSAHPNIDSTGSIRGMKKLGYWGSHDRVILSDGFAYNIDRVAVFVPIEAVAADACRCVGCMERIEEMGMTA